MVIQAIDEIHEANWLRGDDYNFTNEDYKNILEQVLENEEYKDYLDEEIKQGEQEEFKNIMGKVFEEYQRREKTADIIKRQVEGSGIPIVEKDIPKQIIIEEIKKSRIWILEKKKKVKTEGSEKKEEMKEESKIFDFPAEAESQLTQEELTEKIEEIVFAKEDKFDELKDEYED